MLQMSLGNTLRDSLPCQSPSLIADSWAMMPGTVKSVARMAWQREPL